MPEGLRTGRKRPANPPMAKAAGRTTGRTHHRLERQGKCREVEGCLGSLRQQSVGGCAGRPERIDHRSYERQGIDKIPSIHLGVAASQMERKGIATEKGNINRQIAADNKLLKEIKARITRLYKWTKSRRGNRKEKTVSWRSFTRRSCQQGNPAPGMGR